jgi:hypothetical protein
MERIIEEIVAEIRRRQTARAMLTGEINGLWLPRAAYTCGRFR